MDSFCICRRFRRYPCNRKEKGLALIITLLILVAMALASVGLMRSLDTSQTGTGNVALRQVADAAASVALERSIDEIEQRFKTEGGDKAFYASKPAAGYYAFLQPSTTNEKRIPDVLYRKKIDLGTVKHYGDIQENDAYVVIERVCAASAEGQRPDSARCAKAENIGGGISLDSNTGNTRGSGGTGAVFNPLYRISVRVDGPKNASSFMQATVFLK